MGGVLWKRDVELVSGGRFISAVMKEKEKKQVVDWIASEMAQSSVRRDPTNPKQDWIDGCQGWRVRSHVFHVTFPIVVKRDATFFSCLRRRLNNPFR